MGAHRRRPRDRDGSFPPRTKAEDAAFGIVCALALGSWALSSGGDVGLNCPSGTHPFAPTDLAFGIAGELYVTDAVNGSVFRVDGERCVVLAEGWTRPFGVTVRGDGCVCVSHFTETDPLVRESAVSCWDGSAWVLEARGLGSGVNGLAATPDGIWVAAWADTPVEARRGLIFLVTERGIRREIPLEDGVPRFLTPRPDGGLLVTVVREDASGITGGAVLSLSPDGRLARSEPAFDAPAGVAWSDPGVWVVDERSGDLAFLSPDGRRWIHPRFARGASGLAVSAEGDVCVAEPGRSRITCASSHALLGEETTHDE